MKQLAGAPPGVDDEVLAVYDRTSPELYRYASRLTGGDRQQTQDLVQDTFVHLIQRVRDGRVDPALIEIGWLVQSCRQRYLEHARSQHRRTRRERRASVHHVTSMNEQNADAGDDEMTAALAGLSPEHRSVLVLRYVDDLPVADIATALGRSVRATESLLVRARDALRNAATNATTNGVRP